MNTELTIGSKELAEMTEKRHDSVKRLIDRIARQGVIKLPQIVEASVTRKNGRTQAFKEYVVDKRDSYIIVGQLSPLFLGKLVDRWMELEEGRATPLGFTPDVRDFDAEIAKVRKESDWKTARAGANWVSPKRTTASDTSTDI